MKYWEVARAPDEDDASFERRLGDAHIVGQRDEGLEWWRRVGTAPDCDGKRVLDFGCGYGALSLDALRRGASYVLGVDVDARRVSYFNRELARHAHDPTAGQRLEGYCGPIERLPVRDPPFDLVLSKDTFEHVADVRRAIEALSRHLVAGGSLVAGFSPLFFSPFGDHGRYRLHLPWAHALLPARLALRLAGWRNGRELRSAEDLGLNRVTLPTFLEAFDPSVWTLSSLRVNPGRHPLTRVFDIARRSPALAPYFTVGVYAVFTRRA